VNILPKKFIFSPVGEKIVKNFPHVCHFQKWKFFEIALYWEKIVKLSIFWGKNYKNLQI